MAELATMGVGISSPGARKFPPNGPHQVAVGTDGTVYVTNEKDQSVSIRTRDGKTQVIQLPLNQKAKLHLRFSPAANMAIVLADTKPGVMEHDVLIPIVKTQFGDFRAEQPLPIEGGDYGPQVGDIAPPITRATDAFDVDQQTGWIYFADKRSGNLHQLIPGQNGELEEGKVTENALRIGTGDMIVGADSAHAAAFVLNRMQGLFRITREGEKQGPIQVGVSPTFQMRIAPQDGTAGIISNMENKFRKVLADGTILATTLPAGDHRIGVDEDSGAYLITNAGNNTLHIYIPSDQEGPTGKMQDPFVVQTTGKKPLDIEVDSRNNLAFIQNGDGTMTVLDPNAQTVHVSSVDAPMGDGVTIPTMEKGARAMAVDSEKPRLYIANEETGTITVIPVGEPNAYVYPLK